MSSGDPETRKRILEETRRLMEKRHGKDVRLEDIAKAAKVSRQAVYMHFGSRTGLLVAAARYLDETLRLVERTAPIYEAETAAKALEMKVEWWGNYIPDIYGLAKALMDARESDDAAAAAWDDRMEQLYTGFTDLAHRMETEGVLDSQWTVTQAADYLWAALSITAWENLTIERGWTQEQYIQHMQLTMKKVLLDDKTSK